MEVRGGTAEAAAVLHAESFVERFPKADRAFARAFCATQAFAEMCDERLLALEIRAATAAAGAATVVAQAADEQAEEGRVDAAALASRRTGAEGCGDVNR